MHISTYTCVHTQVHTHAHKLTAWGKWGVGNRIPEFYPPICPGNPQGSQPSLPPDLLLTDHLLAADPTDAHNLHSLTSIVDSITVEDVSVAFPNETMPN